jgi:hypothetical protein
LWGSSPVKRFEVEYTKPDGTVALTTREFSVKKIMAALSPQLRRVFGLFFDVTLPYTLKKLLDTIAAKFKAALFAIPKLVFNASLFVVKCLPPFTIIPHLHMDFAKAIHFLDFNIRKLPYRILQSLRRIVQLPRDVYRFCGSMKMMLQFMRNMMRDESRLPMLKQISDKSETAEEDSDLNGDLAMKDDDIMKESSMSAVEEEHKEHMQRASTIREEGMVEEGRSKKGLMSKLFAKRKDAEEQLEGEDENDDDADYEEANAADQMDEQFETRMSTSNSSAIHSTASASRTLA